MTGRPGHEGHAYRSGLVSMQVWIDMHRKQHFSIHIDRAEQAASAPTFLDLGDLDAVLPDDRLEGIQAPFDQLAQVREPLIHLAPGRQIALARSGDTPKDVLVQNADAMIERLDAALDSVEPLINAFEALINPVKALIDPVEAPVYSVEAPIEPVEPLIDSVNSTVNSAHIGREGKLPGLQAVQPLVHGLLPLLEAPQVFVRHPSLRLADDDDTSSPRTTKEQSACRCEGAGTRVGRRPDRTNFTASTPAALKYLRPAI